MTIINITVRNKIAVNPAQDRYVCGNSDYIVRFDFDAEWDAHETKTARFVKEDGSYVDQLFSGSDCPVPVISDTYKLQVGVYAGNLSTTTAAYVPCKKSILCGGGAPAAPAEDVYNQIMAVLNEAQGNANDAKETLDEAFGEGALYLVTAVQRGSQWYADRTQEEIKAAVKARKTCLYVKSTGEMFTYYGEKDYPITPKEEPACPVFVRLENVPATKLLIHETYVLSTGVVRTLSDGAGVRTPNPKKLTFTGAVEGEYNGSEAVTVNIPQGGSGGGCIVNAVGVTDNNANGLPEYGKADKPFNEVWEAMDSGYVALRVEVGGMVLSLPVVAKGTQEGTRMIMFRDLSGTFDSATLMDIEDGTIILSSAV